MQKQFHAFSSAVRISVRLCAAGLLLFCTLSVSAIGTRAQEAAETIRTRTRVVFLDALVKDKHTGLPISDLQPENFEVLDEGQSRPISYFTREGQARKPLALVLILDLREDGAGRFLKQPEVLKMMADELAKLPPADEVAILAVNIGEDEKRIWLSDFTHDAGQLQAALARVPDCVGEPKATDNAAKEDQKHQTSQGKGSISIGPASGTTKADPAATPTPTPDDVLEVQVIKGKNGAVVTRTVKKDGSVSLKRVSSSGHVTVELEDVYDMVAAVKDATHRSEQQRPNSQPALVWVSDGIVPVFFEDRDATEQYLIRSNVIFNSLTADLRTLYKFLLPFGKPVMGWMGISVYGAAKRLAQQSGGEAVRVNRVKDYGSGLSTIIGNLTARYSLGFTLAEQENDDGRLHNLDVRVKAQDEKGKTRKLNVSARKGYYMSTTTDKEATASRAN
ncbi:MAG: VWA domain-containing protein [Pyrinomonadaceae bacterium]